MLVAMVTKIDWIEQKEEEVEVEEPSKMQRDDVTFWSAVSAKHIVLNRTKTKLKRHVEYHSFGAGYVYIDVE